MGTLALGYDDIAERRMIRAKVLLKFKMAEWAFRLGSRVQIFRPLQLQSSQPTYKAFLDKATDLDVGLLKFVV